LTNPSNYGSIDSIEQFCVPVEDGEVAVKKYGWMRITGFQQLVNRLL
jgi:hypothetical protein